MAILCVGTGNCLPATVLANAKEKEWRKLCSKKPGNMEELLYGVCSLLQT